MLEAQAKAIRLLLLDVDGVLTDGRIHIGADGSESKAFDVKDGQGIKLLLRTGIEVALITSRVSEAVNRRAAELGISQIHQGVKNKGACCRRLIQRLGLERDQVCAVGDDLVDLALFAEAGLRIAVADAVADLRERADWITRRPGGRGAIREVSEWILKAQGKWAAEVARFDGNSALHHG
jgi:phenylphosphate carboxylase delta subunit